MNRTIFKALSIIMALCVFLGLMPVSVYAEDDELTSVENVEMLQFSPETEIELKTNTNINKFYASTEVDTLKYFYNQLTTNQKAIYDQVKAAGPVESIDLNLTGVSFTGTGTSTNNAKASAQNNVMQDIMMALTALNEDDPLFFWAAGFGISYGGSNRLSSGSYTYTITRLIINITLNTTHFANFNDVKAKRDAIVDKLATIPVYGISRHEKIKSIHDYLADNLVYDDTISESNIFDAYGALITGVCVCEGYAEAFKLLCDREGIPCITVVGTGDGGAHKWNMVLMEDGEWYTLDSTWDDQESNTYYSYLLIGSKTKAPYFNASTADSAVHIPTGMIFNGMSTALVYPTLSTDSYGIGILKYGAKDVQFDTARGVIMVGKDVTDYQNFIVSGTAGYTRIKTGSGTTTSTLKVSDGTTTKTYLVAMRGDIDASNATNSTDYSVITGVCATTETVENDTAKFYAGDMNQDGAIDGFDAIALDLYMNDMLLYN